MTNFEKNRQILYNLVKSKTLGHFYIFEGNNVDKIKEFAYEIFAKIFDTEDIDRVSDFKIIGKKDSTIDNIRKIIKDSHIAPYKDYKIYLFEDGETLSLNVQNALLKTLEEPSEYAIFVIIIQNSSILLPTVISRAQVMNFDEEDKNIKSNLRDTAMRFFTYLIKGDFTSLFKFAEEIKKKKDDFKDIIYAMMSLTQEMIRAKYEVIDIDDKNLEKIVIDIRVTSLARNQEILEDVLEKFNKNCYFKGVCDYMIFSFLEVYVDRSNWSEI